MIHNPLYKNLLKKTYNGTNDQENINTMILP